MLQLTGCHTGVPGRLLQAIQSLYDQSESTFPMGFGLQSGLSLVSDPVCDFHGQDLWERRLSGLGTSKYIWHLLASLVGLQLSMKWLEWRSEPLSLRPWVSAGTWWSSDPSFKLKGSSGGHSGILLGCLLGASLGRCTRLCQLGGDPKVEPGITGATLHAIWPGNASGSPRGSWKALLGRRRSGIPLEACCLHDLTPWWMDHLWART